jgi:hypothetical protein
VAAFGSLIGSLNGDKRTVGLLKPVLVKFFSIEDNPMRTLHFAVAALGLLSIQPASAQNNPNLFPKIEIRPQTDAERLQTFKPPPPPPTTYPNISGGDRGDPRLNVNKDVSVGGKMTPDSVEGNVRFPIPGQR